jgi:hypothetical protein
MIFRLCRLQGGQFIHMVQNLQSNPQRRPSGQLVLPLSSLGNCWTESAKNDAMNDNGSWKLLDFPADSALLGDTHKDDCHYCEY